MVSVGQRLNATQAFQPGGLMTLRNKVIFFAICVMFFAPALSWVEELQAFPVVAAPGDQEQKTSEVQSQEHLQTEVPEDQEELENEELSPASVELDTSSFPPLILGLYQATRETKEKAILAKLAEIRGLIEKGPDVKAIDSSGRTALHWAGMGSSYSTKTSLITAYTEVADQLIARGTAVNHEDIYNNTVLDYLLYSPNFEMQTLLLENGATTGSLAALVHLLKENRGQDQKGGAAKTAAPEMQLTPGLVIPIRLKTPVWSDKSR